MEVKSSGKRINAFSRIGWAMVVTMIVINFIQNIFVMFMVKNTSLTVGAISFLSIAVGFYLIGFPIFYFMTKSLPTGEKRECKKLSFWNVLALFCIAYGLVYSTNLVTTIIMTIIGMIKGTDVVNPLVDLVGSESWVWSFIFAGILAPIMEELMFRGIMLNKLRGYGDNVAIVTTAVLFGLFHGNFSQFFYATALGLVFSYVTLKTGKIIYAIILHMGVNMIGSVVGMFVLESESIVILMLFGICVVAIAITGIVFLALHAKKVKLLDGEIKLEKGTVFKKVWINTGMIVFVVLCLIKMIYILFL